MTLTREQKRLVWRAAGIALLLFVLWVFETAPSFRACTKEQADDRTHQAEHNLPVAPLTIPIEAATHVRCGWRIVYEYRDAITAVATVLLAFFTWTLWHATDKLVKGGEDTAERQLRAYVSIHLQGLDTLGVGAKPGVRVKLANDGQTPAFEVRTYGRLKILDYPLGKDHEFPDFPENNNLAPSVVFPRGESNVQMSPGDTTPIITEADWEAIVDGSAKRLCIMILVRYSDAFKRRRKTRACVCVGGETLARMLCEPDNKSLPSIWETASRYNDAD